MSDWIEIDSNSAHIKKEKEKAKLFRKTDYWKNLISKGLCHYCEKKFKPTELTMDHIVPLSRGGKTTKGNVVPACKECNNKKKYLTPFEMELNNLKSKK